ncbi:hypothetical protein D5273_08020 [Enterorhabdus caecimuris]|nr:hypothetical protein [Adlercreutzia caecimuris]
MRTIHAIDGRYYSLDDLFMRFIFQQLFTQKTGTLFQEFVKPAVAISRIISNQKLSPSDIIRSQGERTVNIEVELIRTAAFLHEFHRRLHPMQLLD